MLLLIVTCDLYLSHFTDLLNPNFSAKNFLFYSFDKVTTGMHNFVAVIRNSNLVGATNATVTLSFSAALSVMLAKKQFLGQVKISFISLLINGIFKVLQKLLKCFSGITNLVSFIPTLFSS